MKRDQQHEIVSFVIAFFCKNWDTVASTPGVLFKVQQKNNKNDVNFYVDMAEFQ